MNELLKLMLVHYYQDSKRATNATITRRIDKAIRSISNRTSGVPAIVDTCKKLAEANKRKERTAAKQSRIPHMHHGNPHVDHRPCGK